MDAPSVQPSSSAPVLMPALVPAPFDYLVPIGTPEGAVVEATLAGRKLVGVVWQAAPEGNSSAASGLRSALRREPRAEGVSEAKGAMPPSGKKFQLKPITRVIENLPPLPLSYRQWLDWVAEFTLAPKGAVLSLCGLAHAAKAPKKPYAPAPWNITLPTLTPAQQQVAEALLTAPEKPILLDGVTGSGKTEVYFHAIAAMLQNSASSEPCVASHGEPRAKRSEGVSEASWSEAERASLRANGGGTPPSNKQLLILLPEIALTHQWLARFEKTFGAAPIVWHSRMTPVQKSRAWQAIARGEAQVVVGARSALFLPFANLSLIIVDEEHDPSYKQEDGVLYHARDMAVARARFEGIPIILASATPSLETLENVREGKYRALTLPERFGAAGLPAVELIDMRIHPPERGDFLSPLVKKEMLETLARGEQVLLFLNRRGYAPLLLCRHCGHRFQCADCSAWLTVHSNSRLHCHHCDHREPMPKKCPSCNADAAMLAPCGPGVERIAEEARAMFAHAQEGEKPPSLAILSSDEAIAAGTWEAIERGEVDIIVGTQMVAKGHHFPRLTLVVVVDADVGLSGADLRAGERSYQLLHQLGGRAGRGELAGRVLVQTYEPQHPVMQSLAAHDRARLMALEAKERRAGGWPPFGSLAAILLDGVDEAKVRRTGQILAQSAPVDPRLTVLGPAPAPLSKLRGQFRYRILVKAKPGIHLQRTLRAWLDGQKFTGVRIKIDVNPYYFM
jgi:primosomal protein N' (replication factor Y)